MMGDYNKDEDIPGRLTARFIGFLEAAVTIICTFVWISNEMDLHRERVIRSQPRQPVAVYCAWVVYILLTFFIALLLVYGTLTRVASLQFRLLLCILWWLLRLGSIIFTITCMSTFSHTCKHWSPEDTFQVVVLLGMISCLCTVTWYIWSLLRCLTGAMVSTGKVDDSPKTDRASIMRMAS